MDARPGTLIDLDLVPRVAEGDFPQRRRTLLADFRRRAGLAGCLLLVLLAVARAAPPSPPSLVEAWLRDVGSPMEFTVSGDRLVVTARDPDAPRAHTVSAYELPSGRVLWSAPHRSSGQQVVAHATGDVVLVYVSAPDGSWESTTVLDVETGAIRWSRPGWVSVAGDGRTGLASTPADRGRAEDPPPVTAVDLASGTTLWSIPAMTIPLTPPDPGPQSQLLLLTPAGTVEVRDLRTGAVVETRMGLPEDASPAFVGNDLIVVQHADGHGRMKVSAYALPTLALRWSLTEPKTFGLTGCGRLVCMQSPAGLTALDDAGVVVWRRTGEQYAIEMGDALLSTDITGAGLALDSLVDPTTGRTLLNLTGWQLAGDAGDDVLVVRSSAGEPRSWFAVVDSGAPAVRMLGSVPHRISDCQTGPASVVCRVDSDQLGVWAYRR
jgi:outer membrane protein assembly factor BamB